MRVSSSRAGACLCVLERAADLADGEEAGDGRVRCRIVGEEIREGRVLVVDKVSGARGCSGGDGGEGRDQR